MNERTATRVVLLARAGDARDRLGAALLEAGAEITLVADPLSADPQDIVAAHPQAVLVALEPAVEDALARFDAVLSDPSVSVIFEEAELAAQRAGWDAARWVRHLAAKLNRHDDVLPPGAELEGDWQPSPGPLPPVRDAAAHDIAPFTDEAQEHAVEVPRDTGVAAEVHLDDGIADELTIQALDDETAADAPAGMLELVDADELFATIDPGEDIAGGLIDDNPADDESIAGETVLETDASPLELVDSDSLFATITAQQETATDAAPFVPAHDLEALDERVSTLSLADVDSYGHGPMRGAVLVEGGLGGPDAVRQLLAALPENFPRPVLIRLQIDGGRYDRLVKQMERVARLPVALAEIGHAAEAGRIYFVPPGMSLAQEQARLVFIDESEAPSIMLTLPAGDSAVLLMSGSNVSIVDNVMAQASAGLLVAGQSLEGCYDGAASTALAERGGVLGTPVELVEQLAGRWPS